MKKRIVKLTESDVERLVNKIIKENQSGGHTQDEMNEVWEALNELMFIHHNYSVKIQRAEDMMDKTFNDGSMSVESFVDQLESHMGYERDYLISVLTQIQEEGI